MQPQLELTEIALETDSTNQSPEKAYFNRLEALKLTLCSSLETKDFTIKEESFYSRMEPQASRKNMFLIERIWGKS